MLLVSGEPSITLRILQKFKMFKISSSDFGIVSIRRLLGACAYEFFTMITKGVVRGVPQVVIWFSFSVIQRHKAS